jgi:hypothetical protein
VAAEAGGQSRSLAQDRLAAANGLLVAHQHRDQAAWLASLAAARVRAAKIRVRILEVLEVEAEMAGFANPLMQVGNRAGGSHTNAASQIRHLVIDTRRAATMPPHLVAGKSLLSARDQPRSGFRRR